jgi:hypothetical protein
VQSPQFDVTGTLQLPQNLQPHDLAKMFIVSGVASVAMGIISIILAIFVRGGRRGATIGAIVLSCLLLLLLLINGLSSLLQGMRNSAGPNASLQLVFSMCFAVAALAVFGLQLYWLILALRAAPNVQALQNQFQAQYWQYWQQQQAYMQPGYPPAPPSGQAPVGYAPFPPLPAPPPAQASPDANPSPDQSRNDRPK